MNSTTDSHYRSQVGILERVKYRVLLVALVLTIATAGVFIGVQQASAQATLTDAQREAIRTNCVSIKNTLNQLKVSDALLRVNRGQVYESMRSKLMDRFNGRLESKGLDNRGVGVVTGSYASALDAFRSNYVTYERQLASTIRIDCTQDPDSFRAALQLAREKRTIVHDDVNRLHALIDDYRNAAGDFRLNFERVSNGENQ